MKKLIKFDIQYFLISKSVVLLLFVFGAFSFLINLFNYQYSFQLINLFNRNCSYYESIGEDVTNSLQQPYVLHDNDTIENPLSFYNSQIEKVLPTISLKNAPSTFLEGCTLFLPIFIVMICSIIVSYDEKNMTKRLKIVRNGKLKFLISKHISGLILIFFLMIFSFLIFCLLEYIFEVRLTKDFDLSQYSIKSETVHVLFKQLLYTIISAIVYFELFYTLCNIFHSYTIVTMAVCLVSLFVPPLFKYDLINIKCVFENKFFKFNGAIHSNTPIIASTKFLIIEIFCIIILSVMINHTVFKKRSSF